MTWCAKIYIKNVKTSKVISVRIQVPFSLTLAVTKTAYGEDGDKKQKSLDNFYRLMFIEFLPT